MGHHTYDDLIALVAEFRLEHRNLTGEDLDKLVKQTFKIDRATLREIDGVSDLINQGKQFLRLMERINCNYLALLFFLF